MQYRYPEDPVSLLGFGCMRFPRKNGVFDRDETEKQIMHAIKNGVSYFDTAYIYRGSEELLGSILEKNRCRDQVKIATKLPHYFVTGPDSFNHYFDIQKKRLRTGRIDYYLMHMLPDVGIWEKLKAIGAAEWAEKKKASGEIGRLGFSYHGGTANFKELIDSYPWDFCQIQYNYMDENSQAGRRGLEYAAGKGMPVIVMEPLRGGLLAGRLPEKAVSVFRKASPERSPAEWALRWLFDQPEVSCVLSGMNSMEMLDENIRTASESAENELTEKDRLMFEDVKAAINSKMKVGCTGCHYCMPCPFNVDIPGSFRSCNASYIDGYLKGFKEYLMCTSTGARRSNASLCVSCGRCLPKCPQKINIPDELKKVSRHFENPAYKAARAAMHFIQTHKRHGN